MAEKNLPYQINYLQFPVIIRSFNHSKNERKKLPTKFQNIESHYCLEHLCLVPRVVSSMLCSWLVINCKAKDISIKFGYFDHSHG